MKRMMLEIACGALAVLLSGLSPALATAQTVAMGSGLTTPNDVSSDGFIIFNHIAVNAWLDAKQQAHGTLTWQGDVYFELPDGTGFRGGPADSWEIDVTDFAAWDERTVFVGGIVVKSANAADEGYYYGFYFTDNSGTGEPDEINFQPIDSGNIIVR